MLRYQKQPAVVSIALVFLGTACGGGIVGDAVAEFDDKHVPADQRQTDGGGVDGSRGNDARSDDGGSSSHDASLQDGGAGDGSSRDAGRDAGRPDLGTLPDVGSIDGGDFGTTRVPITDLGHGLYKSAFVGGLYGRGENEMPIDHLQVGINRANSIEPLDAAGNPSAIGAHVMISVGMSNTTMEFCNPTNTQPCRMDSFMGRAARSNVVNHTTLQLVNGAMGSQVATTWDQPTDSNYDRVRDQMLTPRGLSERQVQIAWVKVANPGPLAELPAANADAYVLIERMGNIVRALRTRYPNIKMVFLSSRIYGGYATTPLNPEPYAYESAFAVKMLIDAQIEQHRQNRIVDPRAGDLDYNTVAPYLSWSAYLWADGTNARSDGVVWNRDELDFQDGTHPSAGGQAKVGSMLIDFFATSPVTKCWFLANGTCP